MEVTFIKIKKTYFPLYRKHNTIHPTKFQSYMLTPACPIQDQCLSAVRVSSRRWSDEKISRGGHDLSDSSMILRDATA